MSDLAFLSATELAHRINDRSVSAVELLEHYLERVFSEARGVTGS